MESTRLSIVDRHHRLATNLLAQADQAKGNKPDACPVFVSQPDGNLSQAMPPGYKDQTPPGTPRFGPGDAPLAWADEGLLAEFEYIFMRHEKLFLSLLLMEFVVEAVFNVMYIYYASYSVHEVAHVYQTLSIHTLWVISSVLWISEITYCAVYYSMGFVAVWSTKPHYYAWFASVALVGIFGQVLLAYMNKFNILVFFLRLLSYIYAKFLRNLLQSMNLLPAYNEEI